jgi:hypothetical protein
MSTDLKSSNKNIPLYRVSGSGREFEHEEHIFFYDRDKSNPLETEPNSWLRLSRRETKFLVELLRADKKVRHSLANDLEKFSNNEENEDG